MRRQARLNSFEKNLGLKGNQFNTAVSLLNVTYVLMQIPRSVSKVLDQKASSY